MITDIFLFVIGGIIYALSSILGAITWTIPSQIADAISWAFSQLHYLDIFFPVDTLMQAIGFYITFLALYYGIKITMWTYHLIRHGGSAGSLPTIVDQVGTMTSDNKNGTVVWHKTTSTTKQ